MKPGLPMLLAVAALVCGACGGGSTSGTLVTTPPPTTPAPGVAFFYQDVNDGFNTVKVGFSSDMRTVTPYNVPVLQWQVINGSTRIYSDPVMSRLSNGRWAMTASAAPGDSRGSANLLYYESSCPQVDDRAVRVIVRSGAAGCVSQGPLVGAKPSQIFEANGSNYMLMMIDGRIHLVRLTDALHAASDLTSICVRQARAPSLEALGWGEATLVIDEATAPGVRLSDTGITLRPGGGWTLIVKSISATTSCAQGSLCELCARNVNLSTSTDLLTWTQPGTIANAASVPDLAVAPDGALWAYWQSFVGACSGNDINLAARARISTAAEVPIRGFVDRVAVVFTGEPFETDARLHYPTNANPVRLPDAVAKAAFDACFSR